MSIGFSEKWWFLVSRAHKTWYWRIFWILTRETTSGTWHPSGTCLSGRRKKVRERGRERKAWKKKKCWKRKGTSPQCPSLLPVHLIPYPSRCPLRKLVRHSRWHYIHTGCFTLFVFYTVCARAQASIFMVFWPFRPKKIAKLLKKSERWPNKWSKVKTLEDKPRSGWPLFHKLCEQYYRKSCKYIRNNSTKQKGKTISTSHYRSKFRAQRYGDKLNE